MLKLVSLPGYMRNIVGRLIFLKSVIRRMFINFSSVVIVDVIVSGLELDIISMQVDKLKTTSQ